MAIVHNAWLFSPESFAQEIEGYSKFILGNGKSAYKSLRSAAISALDQNPFALDLADRYGGWD